MYVLFEFVESFSLHNFLRHTSIRAVRVDTETRKKPFELSSMLASLDTVDHHGIPVSAYSRMALRQPTDLLHVGSRSSRAHRAQPLVLRFRDYHSRARDTRTERRAMGAQIKRKPARNVTSPAIEPPGIECPHFFGYCKHEANLRVARKERLSMRRSRPAQDCVRVDDKRFFGSSHTCFKTFLGQPFRDLEWASGRQPEIVCTPSIKGGTSARLHPWGRRDGNIFPAARGLGIVPIMAALAGVLLAPWPGWEVMVF